MSKPPPTPQEKPEPPPIPQNPGQTKMADDPGMRVLLPVGRSGLAIAAGYLGLFAFIPFFAPFALMISIIALLDFKKAKEAGEIKYGRGRAIFGLIMGILGTVALGFIILAMISG